MKITSSVVEMSSTRQYASYAEVRSAEMITTAQQAATLEFSREGGDLLKQMEDNRKELEDQRRQQQEKSMASLLSRESSRSEQVQVQDREIKTPSDLKLEVLKKMLEALRRMQNGHFSEEGKNEIRQLSSDYRKASRGQISSLQSVSSGQISLAASSAVNISGAASASPTGKTGWVKTTVQSAFVAEAEHTAYQAAGVARTADGREINFGVTVEMSRAFCARYDSLVQEDYICTDPLVINLGTNVASVTDQKFLFDLDADGKEEEISFAGQGSGFLALDKDGDGRIGDGSELFGTKSGNGFADLAEYDRDGNGWIDENDEIFYDLKVWTKDENGEDLLIDLKKADVGAIYLGYADTEFSLNNQETNSKNGIVRSTGIYLKESGVTGTVQHVDLVL